jgi:hypothetical protein
MGSTESWVYINGDGALVLHTENDGWRFLRRGAEAAERIVTLDELEQYPRLHEEASELLANLAGRDA